MELSEFRGMGAKMEQLMRSAQAGRIVHALLFTGPHGTGKRSMADLFARALLCAGSGKRPCGVCPSCKKCADGVHPDVHVLAPDGNSIKVDPIRDLIADMGMTAYEGGKKIAIIERADRMNENAQNALLKTLENPTGDAIFLLLTDAPGALLPTVVSRCLNVRFSCLSCEECAAALRDRGVEPERAKLLAELAQGSVGRALEIDADADYLPLRQRVLDAMRGIRGPADVLRASTQIGDVKGREGAVLEILETWALELMRAQNGMSDASETDNRILGSELMRRVILVRAQLEANLTWTNVFEPMAFALTGKKE